MWTAIVGGLLLASAVSILFMLLSKNRNKIAEGNGEKPLPPGSMGLPFIGETLQFLTPFKSSVIGPYLLTRISRYGDIFKTNIFGQPTIIIANAEINQFVFQNEGRLFKCSYPAPFVSIVGKYNILETHGAVHKKLRQISLNLLGFENLRDTFLEEVESQVVRTLSSWSDESVIHMKEEAANITFIVLMSKFINFDPEAPESNMLMQKFSDFMRGLFALPIRLPGTTYSKCLKARDYVVNTLNNIISERKMVKGPVNKDFLDTILEYRGGEDDEEFNDQLIVDFLFAFLLAAYDSTSIAMSMALKYLTETPKALQQLKEEHEAIILKKKEKQDKNLTWEDYKSMEFTLNVIKETLRLSNIGPFLYRECIQDTEIRGYRIPKGWKVIACTSAVSVNPSIFPDPSTFNPWRWQKNQTMVAEKHFQAFGGGSRFCVGADLAKLQMAVFLHHMVTKFRWEEAQDSKEEIIRCPLVLFRNGFPVKVQKRSPIVKY